MLNINLSLFLCFSKKRDSYYGEKFILDNNKVDEHLANLYKNSNETVRLFSYDVISFWLPYFTHCQLYTVCYHAIQN